MKIVLHRSRILSGAPFITSKWRGSLGSSLSWMDTWYLFVELKGTSQTFLFLFLILSTSPRANSMHLSRAASEASPATSFFRIGTPSWPPLNSARLHRVAILARALKPGLVRSTKKRVEIEIKKIIFKNPVSPCLSAINCAAYIGVYRRESDPEDFCGLNEKNCS